MLSVQSPGYTGMGQRLGTPGGPGGGGGAERHRQCRDLNDLNHLQNFASHLEYRRLVELNARTRGAYHSEVLNCPHRIALPDGEQGQDRHLQLRVDYQQAELTRSAVQPPPNKSVQDVPDWAPPLPAPRKPSSPNKKGFMQKVKYLASKASFSGSGGRGAETTPHTVTVPGVEAGVVAGAGSGGGTGGAEANRQTPCVMVPLRPPPAPAPPPSAPSAPPSPPHAPPS